MLFAKHCTGLLLARDEQVVDERAEHGVKRAPAQQVQGRVEDLRKRNPLK